MHSLFGDIRLAARLLLKDKWFTLAAVAALALGIAANNTVFTLVNGVLLRDLPFDEPDRIVAVGIRNGPGAGNPLSEVSYADARDWQRMATRAFDGIGVFTEDDHDAVGRRPRAGALPQRVHLGERVPVDRCAPDARPRTSVPRTIARAPRRSSCSGTTSGGTAISRVPDVVGRTIRVNGVASTVIGVMPEGFLFPERSFLWRPLAALDARARRDRRARDLRVFGRLKAGVSREQATAELRGVSAGSGQRSIPTPTKPGATHEACSAAASAARFVPLMASMMGAVAFVLLIACANVANLLLSRATTRAREVSVRMSMGASRWRIVRQLLIESLLLATVAGVVGLILSMDSIRLFWARREYRSAVLAALPNGLAGLRLPGGDLPRARRSCSGSCPLCTRRRRI